MARCQRRLHPSRRSSRPVMNMQGIFISFEDGQPGGLSVAVSSGSVANAAGYSDEYAGHIHLL